MAQIVVPALLRFARCPPQHGRFSAFLVLEREQQFELEETQTCICDVWLTVHRNSVWIRKTN